MNISISKSIFGLILCAGAAATFAADACTENMGHSGSGTTLTSSYATGDISGSPYNYEIWYQGGNNSMTYYSNGTFSAKWSGTDDFLARVGLKYNSTKTHSELGYFTADYSYTKSGTAGYGYIGVYGWTKDPEVEYYIVDDWFSKPSTQYLGTKMGELEVDGDTYDIYTYTRVNQPSVSGTSTFPQFFSVRRNPRQCGHIDISAHFKKWDELFYGQTGEGGVTLKLGKFYEVKLLAEAGGSANGSIDYSYLAVTANGSPSENSSSSGMISSSSSAASETRAAYSSNAIPGTIEFENYDYGGQGVAYNDSDNKNEGGSYRTDGVDVIGIGSGYGIGYTIAGEWLEYTVQVEKSGRYDFTLVAATGASQPTKISLSLDGESVATAEVPNTVDDWNSYGEITGETSLLAAGEHVLRVIFDDSYTNIDRITFVEKEQTALKNSFAVKTSAGAAKVFDLQGKFLGTVDIVENSIEKAIAAKWNRAGTFLVKRGTRVEMVKVSP